MTRAWALAATVLCGGCVALPPHTRLAAAPPPDAPYDARAAYVQKHYPEAQNPDHLLLAGGERVYYPEDLLPAVAPDSATAAAIAAHVEARTAVEDLAWLGVVAGVVGPAGLLVAASSVVVAVAPIDTSVQTPLVVGALASGAVLLVVAGGFVAANVLLSAESVARAQAAASETSSTYAQSLLERTAVAVDEEGTLRDARRAPEAAPNEDEGATP